MPCKCQMEAFILCDQRALGCPEMGVQLGGLGERETVLCSLTSLSSNDLQDGWAWSFLHVQSLI